MYQNNAVCYHLVNAIKSVQQRSAMQKNKTSRPNRLRIIGGTFRSRKLTFPTLPGLRPTGDRIRETLFNWLAPHVPGSRCLDLFAGSGALGIEALSRGASQVVFIDSSSLACDSIRHNLNLLDPELLSSGKAHVICHDGLSWLLASERNAYGPFNMVFLDPPFSADLGAVCADTLEQSGTLAPDCLIYLEQTLRRNTMNEQSSSPITPASWLLVKNKQAGNVSYQLFSRK